MGVERPPLFQMGIHNIDTHKKMVQQRDRGRPRTASNALRSNNYQDSSGKYVLTGGLKPWHERIVDYMVLNPHAKIVDVALAFGVTSVWVGRLIKTDAFRTYYDKRMIEHQGLIGTTIVSKMQSVAVKALDKISDKIDSGEVPFGQLKDTMDVALKGLGYTANGAGVSVNVANVKNSQTNVYVAADVVAQAREKLKDKMKENTAQIEADPDAYQAVTSAMDLGVIDAVVVSDGNE